MTPRTFADWLRAERSETAAPSEGEVSAERQAFEAGARAMLETLIDRGYIDAGYADIARAGVLDLTDDSGKPT